MFAMLAPLGRGSPFELNDDEIHIDTIAFHGLVKRGKMNLWCYHKYPDTGNPMYVIITCRELNIHDVYVFPNDSFSNGNQLFQNPTTGERTLGKVVGRTFIFN
jgi:hypothetical protein